MADNKVNSGLLEFSEDQKVFVALDAETGEVQKAVTIDGDGVETDIQGVQPSGKKEITTTAEVNVASYATAQVVDEDLVAGNIKKDVDILGVVGSYEGSVAGYVEANVELRNPNGDSLEIHCARIDESESLLQTVLPTNSTTITFKTVVSSSGDYSTALEVYDITTDEDSVLTIVSGDVTLSANRKTALIKGACVLDLGGFS